MFYYLFFMYIRMPKFRFDTNRKKLIKRAKYLGIKYAERLPNKSLLKIVNRHNIKKRLTKIFNGLRKKTIFTNSELDKAIELYELSFDDLKEIAKRRSTKNYSDMTKDMLYYVLVKSEKSSLESSYLKHLKYITTNDFKKRLNHIKILTTRLGNMLTNVQRKKLYEKIYELKKKYVNTKKYSIHEKVIKEVVNITNNLYNIQKQHIKLQREQTYYGLRDVKNLFSNDYSNYEPIFVRSALKKGFEEYEISRNKNMMSIREYLSTIYLPLKKLIDKKQRSISSEQKVMLRAMVVFVKVNDPFDRYIKYIDSNGLILRKGDNTHKFINELFKPLLENYEKESSALKGSFLIFDCIDLTLVQFIKICIFNSCMFTQ